MADGTPKILIVDDTRENLRLMQAIFENEGFDPVLADSGEVALSHVSSDPPAIVLLDCRMPGMSGFETLIKLKEIAPDLQVIMITAYGDVASAVDAMKRGAEDFLIRPIQSDRLVLTVARALERRDLKIEVENIRRRKRQEQELTAARNAAIEMARLKSEFLARMSHELRTPLHGIIGCSELLLMSSDLGATAREQVEIISSSSQLLITIVDDILDFSKLEAGKVVFNKIPFGLAEILTQTVAALAPIAAEKGLSLKSRIDCGVPQRLRGDPQRLRQVLNNLISNAIKFTPQGHVSVTVTKLEDVSEQALISFEVEDTGIGIPKHLHQSLFQPFVQADSGSSLGGTGLGLAIAARLVDQMGGTITFRSAPGSGSTFCFTARFEREAAPADSPPAPQAASRNTPGLQALSADERKLRLKIRVLVVEDNKTNRSLCALQLDLLGYAADTVEDGFQALEALSRRDYQIVLMDCEMPHMDGYEATAEIRRREGQLKHTIIIALTAHAFVAVRKRCLAAGMDDFLAKPVTIKPLSTALDQWARRIVSGEVVFAAAGRADEAAHAVHSDLNQAYLAEMRSLSAMAGTDVVQDLVDSFLSELPDLLAAVTSAVGAGRLEELRKAAHALKGAASTVGASGFAAKCKHLQDSAEGSKFDLALRDAQDLLAAAEALPDLLRTAAKMQPDSVRASA
jgi:signal transduction histidine kinase/HPt (histidine-containing phosphotransfer) domain-containing protein/BarA-like signal transduction histidine kinase